MPVYEYACACGAEADAASTKYLSAEEDPGIECRAEGCELQMSRVEIALTQPPNTDGDFVGGAILSNGQRIAGSFGKQAKTTRARHGSRQVKRKHKGTKYFPDP